MSASSAAEADGATQPSLAKQKSFIVENAGNLNRETKLAILRIVMMEVGPEARMVNSNTKDVSIDLDKCAASNEDVVRHIYNMVRSRLDALNQPIGRNADAQRAESGTGDGPAKAAAKPEHLESKTDVAADVQATSKIEARTTAVKAAAKTTPKASSSSAKPASTPAKPATKSAASGTGDAATKKAASAAAKAKTIASK